MADDLASLLVDSGRFRVLDRAWLPVAKDRQSRPPIALLRRAATSAGVRYLVIGSARQTVRRVAGPAIGFPAPQGRVPTLLPVVGSVMQRRSPAYRQSTQEIRSCWMEIELIDAETGQVVRRLSARSDHSAHAAATDLAAGLSRLSAQLAAESQ
jgi:hypothetical protein